MWGACAPFGEFSGQKSSKSSGPEKEHFLSEIHDFCAFRVSRGASRGSPGGAPGGLQEGGSRGASRGGAPGGPKQPSQNKPKRSFWHVSPMPSASGLQVLESAAQRWPWGHPAGPEPPFKTAKKGTAERPVLKFLSLRHFAKLRAPWKTPDTA